MVEFNHGSLLTRYEVSTGFQSDGIRTSESVTEGHPDKMMDQIVDGILDSILRDAMRERMERQQNGDPNWMQVRPKSTRVALEGVAKGRLDGPYAGGMLVLAGEVTPPFGIVPDYERVARGVIQKIGYDDPNAGFSHELPHLIVNISEQSEEIARGVGDAEGAGDQGIIFGYATSEDPSLMPLPIQIAHNLTAALTLARRSGQFPWLKPDGKSQVGVRYENGQPVEITNVTLATAHDRAIAIKDVRRELFAGIILPILDRFDYGMSTREVDLLTGVGPVIINGSGEWCNAWGPLADTGEVGRKLEVDTYGGTISSGGGALSGKDCTKIDRSDKYAARFIARYLVMQGLAEKIGIHLAFTIGQRDPHHVTIDTFGTERTSSNIILEQARSVMDLSVPGIIEELGLFEPIFEQTARNGHFGHPEFPWEKTK